MIGQRLTFLEMGYAATLSQARHNMHAPAHVHSKSVRLQHYDRHTQPPPQTPPNALYVQSAGRRSSATFEHLSHEPNAAADDADKALERSTLGGEG